MILPEFPAAAYGLLPVACKRLHCSSSRNIARSQALMPESLICESQRCARLAFFRPKITASHSYLRRIRGGCS